jgi:hypothetical protein
MSESKTEQFKYRDAVVQLVAGLISLGAQFDPEVDDEPSFWAVYLHSPENEEGPCAVEMEALRARLVDDSDLCMTMAEAAVAALERTL